MKRVLLPTSLILLAACGTDLSGPAPEPALQPRLVTEGPALEVPPPPLAPPSLALVDAASGATVLYDQGPETGTSNPYMHWQNWTPNQNFADAFALVGGGAVHAVGIFTYQALSYWTGQTVHVKVLAAPEGPVLWQEDTEAFTYELYSGDGAWGSIWEVRAELATPFQAAPGTTYWIGVSGNEDDLGQATLWYSADNQVAVYYGTSLYGVIGFVGDQMFRLYGPTDPQTKDDCKDGGWAEYGFVNQGQCVRFVETGKDSR